MNTCVFEAYGGFTDELQLAIGKTGTVIGVISLHGFCHKNYHFLAKNKSNKALKDVSIL
jgi:hypothetical protein